jgi:hypothetical protein
LRERACAITFGTGGEGFDDAGFAAFGRDHDSGDTFGCGDGGESFEELEAVHYGRLDVAEDDVEGAFLNFEEGFGAFAGFEDFAEIEAGLAEGAFDDFAHYSGVVDDQDFEFTHGALLVESGRDSCAGGILIRECGRSILGGLW